MDEQWKIVIRCPKYEVSNFGRVRNVQTGIIKSTYLNKAGYECIILYNNGERIQTTVHRLVAESFLENPNKLSDVNHIDEDKLNNKVDNLEWISHKENCQYGTRNKRTVIKKSRRIICEETGEIFLNAVEIKRKYGFDNSLIHKCCKGKYSQCYGYHWSYVED